MIFPDLDVVVVTTGQGWCRLGTLVDLVLASVKSDLAIPADPASAKLLADKIDNVSTEKPTSVGAASKLTATISGRMYRFPPSQVNVKSLSLSLADAQPHYELEFYNGHRFSGPIGLDGLYRTGKPTYLQDLGVSRVYALKGSWRDDSTFVIDRHV
jgi:hypothetical protein